ncbi:MAG TPA: hypothetical protein VJQ79_10435 [Acidimicrobiia bacterium]|nr:hypothetical protein [Acidimicrobiia bacterium]
MHKLTKRQRKVAGAEEAKDQILESASGDEGLVFLVGPRAASYSVERRVQSRAVLQRMSAAR